MTIQIKQKRFLQLPSYYGKRANLANIQKIAKTHQKSALNYSADLF